MRDIDLFIYFIYLFIFVCLFVCLFVRLFIYLTFMCFPNIFCFFIDFRITVLAVSRNNQVLFFFFKQDLTYQLIQYRFVLYFQLLDVVYQEETLLNVMRSVTRNWRSIALTFVLALILVYLFSIVGYLFLQDDFVLPIDKKLESKMIATKDNVNLSKLGVPQGASVGPRKGILWSPRYWYVSIGQN